MKNYKGLFKLLSSISRNYEIEDKNREMELAIIHSHVFGIENKDTDKTLSRIVDYFELFY